MDVKKSMFENTVDLIKVTIWPFMILVFLVFYGSEINQIIKIIPEKLESSSKISVGSLSLEIEKSARITGNFELADIIKNLSENGIRKLLTLGSGPHSLMVRNEINDHGQQKKAYSIPIDIEVFQELEKCDLLKADEPIDKFISYFKSLNPVKKDRFRDNHGSASDSKRDEFQTGYTEYMLPVENLKSADVEKIDRYEVILSENGQKAFNIIVRVIAEQIKKE